MSAYSFHTFMFPFQWKIKDIDDRPFSEQIDLNNIRYAQATNWERVTVPPAGKESDDLYNERNYFYEFVHPALYDDNFEHTIIRHFERNEPKHGEVKYMIDCGDNVYELKVSAIDLDIYSTGVGVLLFYLHNEKYSSPKDVMKINQVGRRVFPPFIGSVEYRGLIANSLEIKGLHGSETGYREDFHKYTNKTKSNQPAAFIVNLINEVAENVELKPVIDDRMFVLCWYKNDEWTSRFTRFKSEDYEEFLNSSHWYEFVFVDDYGDLSCQNKGMQRKIIEEATYVRWQQQGSLYGISRYSMVYLTNKDCPGFLLNNFETMYARMAELILVQKASVLRFSAEVTKLSNMAVKKGFGEKVASLYKEYIRFVNQIHSREVSAQDQGIEMYQKLYQAMNLGTQVEKLDEEIGELYNYVSLREDRKTNETMSMLTWIATIGVPISLVAGLFGMENLDYLQSNGSTLSLLKSWLIYWSPVISILLLTTILVVIFIRIRMIYTKRRRK